MGRKGYIHRMLQHGINVLNAAAEDVAPFETYPITVTLPPEPGYGSRSFTVEGYFDENPAVNRVAAVGVKAGLNGILYIRETQTPEPLTSYYHQGVPVGHTFEVRGRQYRCIKADFARGEYAFYLSDLNEYPA